MYVRIYLLLQHNLICSRLQYNYLQYLHTSTLCFRKCHIHIAAWKCIWRTTCATRSKLIFSGSKRCSLTWRLHVSQDESTSIKTQDRDQDYKGETYFQVVTAQRSDMFSCPVRRKFGSYSKTQWDTILIGHNYRIYLLANWTCWTWEWEPRFLNLDTFYAWFVLLLFSHHFLLLDLIWL